MTSKKLFLVNMILFLLASLPLICSVGASSELWNQTYGGDQYDNAYSMVVTSDGGFALASYTTSSLAGYKDFWLVKTDT